VRLSDHQRRYSRMPAAVFAVARIVLHVLYNTEKYKFRPLLVL